MSLAAIPLVIQVLVAALAGYGVGTVHFRSLAPVTDMMLAGRMLAVVLQLARLAVLDRVPGRGRASRPPLTLQPSSACWSRGLAY